MYRYDDFLAQVHVPAEEDEVTVLLSDIVPVGRLSISGDRCRVFISCDGTTFDEIEESGNNKTARYLKVCCDGECRVVFFVGQGYFALKNLEYTNALIRYDGWAGSDGINSFNLTNGDDSYGAHCEDTMFVFGDTFICQVDNKTNRRIEPVYMPNNTYGIFNRDIKNIEFFVSRDEKGLPIATLCPVGATDPTKEWYWLQDGVVLGEYLYLFPMNVIFDETKREGFQFDVRAVTMVKVPIKNKRPDFDAAVHTNTNLYRRFNGMQYVMGISFMPMCASCGQPEGDGFIYIYGYYNDMISNNCRLIVARTKPEVIENTDNWEYYNGNEYVTGMENAVPILEHVSCEMSVMPISAGANKGKFLAVFQYDVQSDFVSYAIGETPSGPFMDINHVYFCDEKRTVDETVYTYNAKAHSHISTPDSILVSYNVNTPSLEANYRLASVYSPRFITLHDTTII